MTLNKQPGFGRKTVLGSVAAAALLLAACSGGDGAGDSTADSTASGDAPAADVLPQGTLTIITPYGAGGTTDVAARALLPDLEAALGRTVIVENRPGASGITGTAEVANATADGSTILFAVDNVFTQSELRDTPYDFESFTGITGFFGQAYLVTVGADSEYETLADLAAASSINAGVSGYANEQHLDTVILFDELGTEASVVPFDGNAPAAQALIGGNVDVVMGDAQSLMTYVSSGDLRVLAVLTADGERLDYLEDVPTLEEEGVDTTNLTLPDWGFAAPSGMPEEALQAWSDAINSAAEGEAFQTFAADNYLVLPDADAAAGWYDNVREEAPGYKALLDEFGIEIQ